MARKKKKRSNLRYQYNDMVWHDAGGNVVDHPRYKDRPNNLDGKVFLNGYLRFVKDGKTLNDYMQIHGRFSSRKVQAQARQIRKLYEEATGQTFSLLRKVTRTIKVEKAEGFTDVPVGLGFKVEAWFFTYHSLFAIFGFVSANRSCFVS